MAYSIEWDKSGEKTYETGVDHGVVYKYDEESKKYGGKEGYAAAWNGLTTVTNSPEGAEPTDLYADNIKYASMRSAETFGGTIEAYTYPDLFAEMDGTRSPIKGVSMGQQSRGVFGLCYRTGVGSDVSQDYEKNYKLHLVYGATCSPSEKSYETINDSPDAITFSWEYTTTPVNTTQQGYKPVSELTIDTTKLDEQSAGKLETLLQKLYGDGETQPELPMPDEVINMLKAD